MVFLTLVRFDSGDQLTTQRRLGCEESWMVFTFTDIHSLWGCPVPRTQRSSPKGWVEGSSVYLWGTDWVDWQHSLRVTFEISTAEWNTLVLNEVTVFRKTESLFHHETTVSRLKFYKISIQSFIEEPLSFYEVFHENS